MKSVMILLICLFILVVFSDFLLSVSPGFHPSDGTSFAAAGAGDGNGDPTPLPPNPPPPPPPTPPPPPV